MSITPIFMAMVDPSASAVETPVVDPGFAAVVQSVQSGAPPGPEPPPGINALPLPEEVGTEPNAPFQELDLLATMKNLTEGFFDGVTVDAPMPTTGDLPEIQADSDAQSDTKNPVSDLQLFMNAGAMVMAAMQPAINSVAPIIEANIDLNVSSTSTDEATSITAATSQPSTQTVLPTLETVTDSQNVDTSALQEGVDSNVETKIQDPIALTDFDRELSKQLDSKQTKIVDPTQVDTRIPSTETQETQPMVAEPGEGDAIRKVNPMPAEPAPIAPPKSGKLDSLDDPNATTKEDNITPVPKPAEPAMFNKVDPGDAGVDGGMQTLELPLDGPKQVETKASTTDIPKTSADAPQATTLKVDTKQSPTDTKQGQQQDSHNPNAQAAAQPVKKTDSAVDVQSTTAYASTNEVKDVSNESGNDGLSVSKTGTASQAASFANTDSVQKPTNVEAKTEIKVLDSKTTDHVIRQVADRLEQLAAAKPRNGVTIHLEPFDLGKVTMTIKSSGSEVEAHITASHEAVRQALEQSRPLLQHALDQRGMNLVSVDVNSQTLTQDAPNRQQQSKNMQPQTHMGSWSQGDRGATTTLAESRNYVARTSGGVNLWI